MDAQQQPQEPDLQLLQRFTDEQIAAEYTRRLSAQVDKLLRELEDTPPPTAGSLPALVRTAATKVPRH